MTWKVDFVPRAAKEFSELSESLREKFGYLFREIEAGGIRQISQKHYKHVEDDLWELRVKDKDNIARSLYVTEMGGIVKILLVFVKKTRKTPRELIELAQKRRST